MRFVKPLDTQILSDVFKNYDKIITVEDGTIYGGFGSAILEFMADKGYTAQIKVLGIPDKFIEHGTPEDLYKECGLDAKGIVSSVLDFLNK
jgi:1-deoxy-D-xylulose-5-phosphate synthase